MNKSPYITIHWTNRLAIAASVASAPRIVRHALYKLRQQIVIESQNRII